MKAVSLRVARANQGHVYAVLLQRRGGTISLTRKKKRAGAGTDENEGALKTWRGKRFFFLEMIKNERIQSRKRNYPNANVTTK